MTTARSIVNASVLRQCGSLWHMHELLENARAAAWPPEFVQAWSASSDAHSDLMPIAIHETGHACVALSLGVQVFRVSVWSTPCGGAGICKHAGRSASVEARLILTLAGPVAKERYIPVFNRGDWYDMRDARFFLAVLLGVLPSAPAVAEQLPAWERRASEHVAALWPWIMRSADKLAHWRKLTGREVLSLRGAE